MDVYAFSMIAFELFEGWAPFLNLHPVDAARRAALHHARPQWGKVNRCASGGIQRGRLLLCCVMYTFEGWALLAILHPVNCRNGPHCTMRARSGVNG